MLEPPQKSPGVDKYGHMAATTLPHRHGGFGEYCYIVPRSWILRLPDILCDAEATPPNCGVATMIAVTEAAGIRNYHPRNLIEALDFVVANRMRFPFHELVDGQYPLERVGDAMADAAARRVLRAAILP